MRQRPIAVFDSGVGGISVLRALRRELPGENFLYFGDSANAPYGSRTTQDIRRLTMAHAAWLLDEAKALVLACNTATSAAIDDLRAQYPDVQIDYYQSNIEGCLIDKMQEVGFGYDGIILNAGAYTHTSIALQDCIRSLKSPVIEVHISNVHKREEFRHKSMISCACLGVICGFGMQSYRLALEAILNRQ